MERKSNITVWQLRLFEGLDRDVMVMQRDEQEVFDEAIHVFFEREYYDAYVSKAKRYGTHEYAYHEDKLGEVINQIFEEQIAGLVLHINTQEDAPKNMLCDERYLSAEDLRVLQDAADSYHYLYTTLIERRSKEETIARLWTKNVYIIGQLPDFRKKEKQTIELMTLKRKEDGTPVEAEYDYESLKVFLTAESAMRFNAEKKPVNSYKLSLLSHFVKGKFHIIIEPHRNYWLEYDPATIDISAYYETPQWSEEKVTKRVQELIQLDELYILMAVMHSDYRTCIGTPFLLRMDEQNVMMYVFERYEDAVAYCLHNQKLLPVIDGIYPIGVLKKSQPGQDLHTVAAIAAKMGVTAINLDMDTDRSIGCRMSFFMKAADYEAEPEKFLDEATCSKLVQEQEGEKKYRFEPIPLVAQGNPYLISEERKQELFSHMDNDYDNGVTYTAECSIPEMICMLNEAGKRFETARQANEEEKKALYNRMMNVLTVPLAEALCEEPYIFTLREENGDFTIKNQIAYLMITNRFEGGRGGDGKLAPAGLDNEHFLEKLEEASRVAAVTDGPNVLCLIDVKMVREIVKQWKKAEPLREEMMIYLTQGCGLNYMAAKHAYKRLKTDGSIYVEFISSVRNGEFPPMGMITVDGYTAKQIAEEYDMNMLQAYDALLSRKEGKQMPVQEKSHAEKDGNKDSNKESNKEANHSFLGKLFKKSES